MEFYQEMKVVSHDGVGKNFYKEREGEFLEQGEKFLFF